MLHFVLLKSEQKNPDGKVHLLMPLYKLCSYLAIQLLSQMSGLKYT